MKKVLKMLRGFIYFERIVMKLITLIISWFGQIPGDSIIKDMFYNDDGTPNYNIQIG